MTKYSTTVALNSRGKRKKGKSERFKKRKGRNYANSNWSPAGKKTSRGRKGKLIRSKRVKKALQMFLAILFTIVFFVVIFILWYIQSISKDLPSPDEPFGAKNTASVIYDRNGVQLYKVIGEENRDPLELPDDGKIDDIIPPKVYWAFLAAEDINFFEHPGFDVTSLVNCGVKNLAGTSSCGGSTVTQQLIKQTVLTHERKVERKVKELILAMQVERLYTKDQILAMYLTVAPMGSNVYGVNTGARFYFGKELQDLNLAEIAILASLPQNPSILSPTLSTRKDGAEDQLKARQNYVLDQMLKYKDKINDEADNDKLVTEEKIDKARDLKLKYVEPRIDIKAPHFVFYVQELLQEREYVDGQPFSFTDLENGGYKFYTTLDYELQKVAEDFVLNQGVRVYGARYGAKNAALTTIRPSTGEILTYVGSKDYFMPKQGDDFDPNVDILTSAQQPGSSAKPLTYYNAFNAGVMAPGTQLPDIPIAIGTYKPKNSDGRFNGMATVRTHLVKSRNIPAIIAVQSTGVGQYVETAKKFGYTTYGDTSNYGPSITLGAAEVKPIEHAQGFGIFANGGNYVRHEVITKIEDKNGNIIYEHKPKKKKVGDPQAVYLVNNILQGVPRDGINNFANDGREVAGKTGTTESQKDTWYVFYSPDFVTVGWLGNNTNNPMTYGAFGSTSVKPWVQGYTNAIAGYFPEKTPFSRPGGISSKTFCSTQDGQKVCSSITDLVIDGREPPVYLSKKTFLVCDDQPNRLARDIDKDTGHAVKKSFVSYTMPAKDLQSYADKYFAGKGTAYPTKECTVDRSPNVGKPWAEFSQPSSGATVSTSLNVGFNAYTPQGIVTKVDMYIDSTSVGSTTSLPYSGSFAVDSYSVGAHTFRVIVTDSTGKTGESSINFNISKGGFTISSPASGSTLPNGPVTVTATYSGPGAPSNVKLCVDGVCSISMSGSGDGPYTAVWTPVSGGSKTYTLYVTDDSGASSNSIQVTIV